MRVRIARVVEEFINAQSQTERLHLIGMIEQIRDNRFIGSHLQFPYRRGTYGLLSNDYLITYILPPETIDILSVNKIPTWEEARDF